MAAIEPDSCLRAWHHHLIFPSLRVSVRGETKMWKVGSWALAVAASLLLPSLEKLPHLLSYSTDIQIQKMPVGTIILKHFYIRLIFLYICSYTKSKVAGIAQTRTISPWQWVLHLSPHTIFSHWAQCDEHIQSPQCRLLPHDRIWLETTLLP